jgi:hypothetical protein
MTSVLLEAVPQLEASGTMANEWQSVGSRTWRQTAVVPMTRRPDASADLKAICAGIGVELRALLSDVLREPIPDGMAELLGQFDQPSAKPSEQ